VSPIASAVRRFRHEFEHYVEQGRAIDGVEPIFGHVVASHG
jgi:hypothetical protein